MAKSKEDILHKQICDYISTQYPKVLYNSDMSGFRLPMGLAVKAKSLRSNKGYPDLQIYEPRGKWHGLFIEIKTETIFKKDGSLKKQAVKKYKKGVLVETYDHLENQFNTILALQKRGYKALFVWTFEQAKEIIDSYLKLPPNTVPLKLKTP